jgi:hypothetical protein
MSELVQRPELQSEVVRPITTVLVTLPDFDFIGYRQITQPKQCRPRLYPVRQK